MRLAARVAAALAGLAAASAAAEPVPLDVQGNHPNGAVMVVRSVDPGEDVTRVALTVTTADRTVRLNHSRSMVLLGEAGERYLLVPPPDNETVAIPANSRLTGEMVFSGRLRPGTRRVTLSTNDGVGGSDDNPFETLPVFKLELPLDRPGAAAPAAGAPAEAAAVPPPPAAAAAPRTVEVDRQANHPNGTVLVLERLEIGADATTAVVRVSTGGREVSLNHAGSMRLVDDLGNRYQAVPPAENRPLRLPASSRVEARVLFAGRLHPDARSLTLSTNEGVGGDDDSPHSALPILRVAVPLGGG